MRWRGRGRLTRAFAGRGWLLVAGAVGVVVVYAVAVAALLLSAKGNLEAGRRSVDAAKKHADAGQLADAKPLPYLHAAGAEFDRAHRKVTNPVVAPLRVLPFLGRQLRSVERLSVAARDVTAAGADGVRRAKALLDGPHEPGPERVALVRNLRDLAARIDARLAGVDLGPRVGLLPPLRDAYNQFSDQLFELRTTLHKATAASDAAAALLAGPRRYLLIAANNAEMRAGSGMFLSTGELETGDGRVAIGDMASVGQAALTAAAAPPITDADLRDRWGWKVPNTDFRELMLSPRFAASAELATKMWVASGHAPVDGVLVLDPIALRAVLAATGPVRVGDLEVSADSVVEELLHRQYVRFGDRRSARREQLGEIARAAFAAFDRGDVDVARLASGLSDAVQGRHLFVWSTRPVEQQGWEAAGVAGAVRADSVLVAVNNRGCNKMDWFLKVDAELSFSPNANGTDGRLLVRVRNTTPATEVDYVTGDCENGLQAGQYPGILAVTLPGATDRATIDGRSRLSAVGPDGPTYLAALGFVLDRGAERTFDVRFHLRPGLAEVRVEPGARVPPTTWRVNGDEWTDSSARTVAVRRI